MILTEFDPIKGENQNRITVFGKKGCVQCKMTSSIFTDNDIDFDYIDIEDVPEAWAYIKSMGFQALPVVMLSGTAWSGFQPERINDVVDAGLWGKPNPQWMKRNKIAEGEIR